MKYVDADLLKTGLTRLGEEFPILTYEAVLYLIDSLQQEQLDFPTTDEQMKEFLATHPKIKVPEKYKNPNWLFKKQEQQREPDKGLDEAANEYASDSTGFIDMTAYRAFKAGWKYRDDQMPMPEDTVLFQKGVAEGRRLEREDMLKDAVHYVVQDDLDSHGASYNIPFIRIGIVALKPKGIEVGDKVKVIILKDNEDESK